MNPSDVKEIPPHIHVLNSVEEVDKAISGYEIETRSAFVVYKKDSSFGSTGKCKHLQSFDSNLRCSLTRLF